MGICQLNPEKLEKEDNHYLNYLNEVKNLFDKRIKNVNLQLIKYKNNEEDKAFYIYLLNIKLSIEMRLEDVNKLLMILPE